MECKCQWKQMPVCLTSNVDKKHPSKMCTMQTASETVYKQPSPFCALDNKPDFTGSATAYLSVSEKGRIHKTVKEN